MILIYVKTLITLMISHMITNNDLTSRETDNINIQISVLEQA